VHTFYARQEWTVLLIWRIDRMRGEHGNAPTDVLASQDLQHVRKRAG
jgi:hypothetical protein